MTDERFDHLMRDAAATWRNPPEPDLEAMWASVERTTFGDSTPLPVARPSDRQPARLWGHQWLRMAAVLVLGLALGRLSATDAFTPSIAGAPQATVAVADDSPVRGAYDVMTDQYLGQAAALLISLPQELRAPSGDTSYVARADNLLMQTRLLLDSPAASDPTLRTLFEDLEIVLAQVVRLPADRNSIEVDLLTQALERRDMLPRLRSAVADHLAD